MNLWPQKFALDLLIHDISSPPQVSCASLEVAQSKTAWLQTVFKSLYLRVMILRGKLILNGFPRPCLESKFAIITHLKIYLKAKCTTMTSF